MKLIKLPERLKVIAGFIADGAAVVDVGSDHGLLPTYLALKGTCRRLIASDISAGSLSAARSNAKIYGVSNEIEFMVADGLSSISIGTVDTIVISGLGGETIRDILLGSPWAMGPGINLILQPQSKIDVLCNFLYNSSCQIGKTQVVVDRGRQYTVIICSGGE